MDDLMYQLTECEMHLQLTCYHTRHNERNSHQLKHPHEYFSWKADVDFVNFWKKEVGLDNNPNSNPCVINNVHILELQTFHRKGFHLLILS